MTHDQILAHLTLHGWGPVSCGLYVGVQRVHHWERVVVSTDALQRDGAVYKFESPSMSVIYYPTDWAKLSAAQLKKIWAWMEEIKVI